MARAAAQLTAKINKVSSSDAAPLVTQYVLKVHFTISAVTVCTFSCVHFNMKYFDSESSSLADYKVLPQGPFSRRGLAVLELSAV